MNSITYKPHHDQLRLVRIELPRRSAHNLATRLADTVDTWAQRSRQRRRLARLDEHLLVDIGVSYEDVWREVNKPFWRK